MIQTHQKSKNTLCLILGRGPRACEHSRSAAGPPQLSSSGLGSSFRGRGSRGVSPGVEEVGRGGQVKKVVISAQGIALALEKADHAALMTSHGYFLFTFF